MEIVRIEGALKANRRTLKKVLGARKEEIVSRETLEKLGYNFTYHTHHVISMTKNYEYTFCFNYGYRTAEDGKVKVVKSLSERIDNGVSSALVDSTARTEKNPPTQWPGALIKGNHWALSYEVDKIAGSKLKRTPSLEQRRKIGKSKDQRRYILSFRIETNRAK